MLTLSGCLVRFDQKLNESWPWMNHWPSSVDASSSQLAEVPKFAGTPSKA